MKITLVFAFVISAALGSSFVALAAVDCAKISDKALRLSCYDEETRQGSPTGTNPVNAEKLILSELEKMSALINSGINYRSYEAAVDVLVSSTAGRYRLVQNNDLRFVLAMSKNCFASGKQLWNQEITNRMPGLQKAKVSVMQLGQSLVTLARAVIDNPGSSEAVNNLANTVPKIREVAVPVCGQVSE